jgi:glutamine synthetase
MEPIRETMRLHPFHPDVAMAHVRFIESNGKAAPPCPRSLLEKALKGLRNLGYTVKASYELEF